MWSPVQGRFLVAPRTEAEDDALVDFLWRKETHWLDSAECKRGVPGLEHLDDNQLLVGNPLRNPSPRRPAACSPEHDYKPSVYGCLPDAQRPCCTETPVEVP